MDEALGSPENEVGYGEYGFILSDVVERGKLWP